MKLFPILASITLGATAFFGGASAQAQRFTDSECRLTNSGAMVCIRRTGANDWYVGYTNENDDTEVFNITCGHPDGGYVRYNSYGNFTKDMANRFADAFCRA